MHRNTNKWSVMQHDQVNLRTPHEKIDLLFARNFGHVDFFNCEPNWKEEIKHFINLFIFYLIILNSH